MEITDVRVFPLKDPKLKGYVSIVIDDCFAVSDIKIIQGTEGLFLSMPSRKRRDGTFKDIAHPINRETRKMLEDRILAAYAEENKLREAEEPAAEPMPEPEKPKE